VLNKLVRVCIRVLVARSKDLPQSISNDMNYIIGKGFGSETVSHEVRTVLTCLTDGTSEQLTVFDVGANIGNYTAALLDSGKVSDIYCFEPSEGASIKLQKRFVNNPKVHLEQVALGKQRSESILFSDFDGSGLASITNRRLQHFGVEFSHSQKIRIETLTSAAKKIGKIPDFIKIDVEGHELDVLKGGDEILKDVKLLQFEFGGTNIDTRTFFQDYWYFFRERDFEILRITKRGLLIVDRYAEEDEYFKPTNYLARNKKFQKIN